jgi:hypothetical protein
LLTILCFCVGSTIDGEPIIALPPKKITLEKVEFSAEERDFYHLLEAHSQAQFKVYFQNGVAVQVLHLILSVLHFL